MQIFSAFPSLQGIHYQNSKKIYIFYSRSQCKFIFKVQFNLKAFFISYILSKLRSLPLKSLLTGCMLHKILCKTFPEFVFMASE